MNSHDAVFGVFACGLDEASADAALRRGRYRRASGGFGGVSEFRCVGSGTAATGFYLDSIVPCLSRPAGKIGRAEVLQVIAVCLSLRSAVVRVTGSAGGPAELRGFLGRGARFRMGTVGFESIVGGDSA